MTKAEQFIAAMKGVHTHAHADEAKLSPEMTARRLLDHYEQLVTTHDFKVGQLVQLKTGFGTAYRYPSQGVPAVVTEVIAPPFVDVAAGHIVPECQLKHDLRIGVVVSDGGFVQFLFPGCFLEPYTGKTEA